MNPYAAFLGNRDALDVIAATARRLTEIVNALGQAGVERKPAPGKWSAREIVCHLADCEVVFAFRLRQTLAEADYVVQPFDQAKWAATYGAFDVQGALATFSIVRAWNLVLIRSLPPEAFVRALTHPERGRMTFQVLVETMAGHDLNHLRQLDAIASTTA
ncbi:MAG: DinB family protein [Bryobacteraceae bacterium]|jgi:hypothetical protein